MEKEWEELTMEEAYRQLDQLLDEMESGEHSLEEMFGLYQKGIKLVQCCHEKIDQMEKQLIILEGNGE
ncbi:MAG: exodeoxyribonuclease VII small subunit [Clostridiales bacterium]|nr:exodeoxyribonuclease VII small subunit [Clostridiales bacterium]